MRIRSPTLTGSTVRPLQGRENSLVPLPPAESLRQTRRLCRFGHYACATDVNCWTILVFSCQEAVFRVYILSVFLCFHIHSRIDLRFNIFMRRSPVSDPDVAPIFRACPEQRECVGTSLPSEFVTCHNGRRVASRQWAIGNPNTRCGLATTIFCISIEFRPSVPAPGIPPCGLRRQDGLGFEKEVELRMSMTAPRRDSLPSVK